MSSKKGLEPKATKLLRKRKAQPTPAHLELGDAVRRKLAELGIDAADVRDAVRWARSGK